MASTNTGSLTGREGKLELTELLRSDGCEDVYRANFTRNDDDVTYEVLLVKTRHANREEAERKFRILRKVQHPHVAQVTEVLTSGGDIYALFQGSGGGTMKQIKNKQRCVAECWAQRIFQGIFTGVDALHGLNIAHCAICLEKMLLNVEKTMARLACFDHVWDLAAGGAPEFHSGRLNHRAPEILKRIQASEMQEIEQSMAKPADIFALGVSLYEMLFGKCPFEKPAGMEDMEFIKVVLEELEQGEIQVPTHQDHPVYGRVKVSIEVHQLLKQMLKRNPERRITMQEIKEHRWFKSNLPFNWDVYNQRAPRPSAA